MKITVIVRAFNDYQGNAVGFSYIGKTKEEAISKFVDSIWDWWIGFVEYDENKTHEEIMNIYKEMYLGEEYITIEDVVV